MRNFVILTDSTSDLNKSFRDKYNIDYVEMNISIDGKEIPASLDWEYIAPKELYDLMRQGKRIKTTQVPYGSFYKKFEQYAKMDMDIVYIACSSALSGSINIAKTVKDEIIDKYPNTRIECIDSLISCIGEGMIVMDAAKMRNDGKTIDEVVEYVESNKLKYLQISTVEDLEYLKRAGRVKASSAFFGNLFGVKPIIMSDALGQNYAFKKVKGRKNSFISLVDYIEENITNPEEQTVYIGHADDIASAKELEVILKERIKVKNVYIDYMGPIVGASVGPGTVAYYFKGKEVTVKGE